jgi:multicomponent Na+:H+ antiporter subunit D
VYAIIRTETLLFPGGRAANLLLVAALLTMVVGILGAVAQSDIKRLLSFTLVSHIGYLLFGVGLAGHLGLSSAIFYVVHHITIQTTLFLAAGLVERRGGSTALDRLGGLGRLSPVLAGLFFVPALNLAGIPPFSGFIGKVGLLQAGADDGSILAWLLVGGGVLTSLLTLYAIARVWNLAFWRSPDPAMPGPRSALLPRLMVAPTLVLVVLGMGLTLAAGPLFAITDQAAADLLERTVYVDAVFRPGTP